MVSPSARPTPTTPKPPAPPSRRVTQRRALIALAIVTLLGLVLFWRPWRAPEPTGAASGHDAASARDGGAAGPLAAAQVSPLHGPREVEGRVQDDLGEPLAGALLRLSSLSAPSAPARETRTNAGGSFRFDDLPIEPLSVEITCTGHEGKEHMLHAQDDEPLTFVLARQGELQVALRDSPGQPVDGTEVVLTGPGVWPAQAGRADAHGELIFKGLPAGDYRLRARRLTRIAVPLATVSVVPGKRTATELVLVDGVSLHGIVRDLQSQKPLAGASVEIQDMTPGIDALSVTANARGEFTASGLWPGAVRVEAQYEGYAAKAEDIDLPHKERIELALAGAASLAGSIVDEAGKPIAGARLSVSTDDGLPVELAGEGRPRRDSGVGELGVTSGPVPALPIFQSTEFALGTLATESDVRGSFHIGRLAPGALALHVARPGYVAERVVVRQLSPHEDRTDLRVVLREAGRVVGRVTDARGHALSGVYVAAQAGEREQSALTDGAGEYTLRDVLGEVLVEAQPDGHSTLRCRAQVAARAEARCDLTADTAVHELLVRVVDTYGIGLEGALVRVNGSDEPAGATRAGGSSQLTRPDGTLVLRELPAPPYLLDVRLAGYLNIDDLRVADATAELRLRMSRAASLAGFVVDQLGRAVPNAFVSTDEGEANTETDPLGAFTLEGVSPGTHALLAHHARAGDGQSAQVRARPSERLDGVRIALNGRYEASDVDGGSPRGAAEERPAKLEYTLEQRGRVLVVTQVTAGLSAAKAGLRIGDVLTAIDGERPLSSAHARGLLRDPSGRTAIVRVLRNKRPVNLRYRRPSL